MDSWNARTSLPANGFVVFAGSYGDYGYVGINTTIGLQIWRYEAMSDSWSMVPVDFPLEGDFRPHSEFALIMHGYLYYNAYSGLMKIDVSTGEIELIELPEAYMELQALFQHKGKLFVYGVAGIDALSSTYTLDEPTGKWLPRNNPPLYQDPIENFVFINIGDEVYTGFYFMRTEYELHKDYNVWFRYDE
jgi:hypothetical protein